MLKVDYLAQTKFLYHLSDQITSLGSPVFGRCPFLPSPNHLRYLNMSEASFLAGAHHFVARDSTFIEAQTVSGMYPKVSV